MPQTFVALQCAFCEAYQVTLDKTSKKFSCAICCQKQSFKKIHAISNSAKDCRKVVQELNELRGARDRELGSDETAAALAHAAAEAAAGCPASDAPQQQAAGWEDFADADDDAGDDGDDWLAGTGEFVTTLPDSSSTKGRGGKRCAKTTDADEGASYKQPRYGQGRGKQQQQQVHHAATASGSRTGLGMRHPPAQLQRIPLQSRQSLVQPQQQQQHQRCPWQPQQQAAPAGQQQRSWQPQQQQQQQQQQQGTDQWSRQATSNHCDPVRKAHTSSAGNCGAAWPQSQPAQQVGWGAALNPQRSQQQHPQQPHPQQQKQRVPLQPPLASTMATVKQQPQQQQGRSGSYSSTQQQRQQQEEQLHSKGVGTLLVRPPPAAAGGGGAWGAFVDEEGPGACGSDEEDCVVDGQGVCCLGFSGPEGSGVQGTAAAPGHHGSGVASRWS